MERIILSWSGGKDSSMAAYELLSAGQHRIAALLTTVTERVERISMHGVRRELLERQAASLQIPLHAIMIPEDCPNEIYEARMNEALTRFKSKGITKIAFGDLFLEDVKRYRDERLAQAGMQGLYPIWKRDTGELVRTFIGLRFKAILACVDTQAISASFAGREIDHQLLQDLPPSADPCGEHGEYHSFVYDGPIFKAPIACTTGERVMRGALQLLRHPTDMKAPRIASFLPAATEMVCLLGLEEFLIGRSHECDYPESVKAKPVLVDCALDLSQLSMSQIDAAVSARLASGKSLYAVDEAKLRSAAPDLLITQNLCQVCGPAGNEVSQVIKSMNPAPKILWQTPLHFAEVLDALQVLGEETGTQRRAAQWIAKSKARLSEISQATSRLRKIRVAFLEWVDPIYCGGHWIPQMLEWAGGEDPNARHGTDSVRIPWPALQDSQPEVIIVAPCGFKMEAAIEQAALLKSRPGWNDLPAVREGNVFAVDANAYFARPGPRLIDGVQLLAHLMHPQQFAWSGPHDAYRRVDTPRRFESHGVERLPPANR